MTSCPTHLSPRDHKTALRRKAEQFRTMADTLFVKADEMDRWRRNCMLNEIPEGAATWRRLANQARTEAQDYIRRADRLQEQAR